MNHAGEMSLTGDTMGTPTVSIIIPTYNGRHHLEECFRSLHALDYPPDRREIILVDNGSTDRSVEYVKECYPEVTVIQNEKNEGFAVPCNLGAERSQSEYLAFLNNDTRVDPEWLKELTRSIDPQRVESEKVVCAAGKIVSWDGRVIDYEGGIMNFHGHGHHVGMGRPASAAPSREEPTLFACAASMLIRKDIFLKVGGFDSDYFAYFEDVDLGWRLWLFGFQVLYCPTAVVFHRGQGTAALSQSERKRLIERNGFFNIFKNYSDATLEQVLPPALSLAAMKASLDLEYSTSYLHAINEFFASLDQLKVKRREIQRRRIVEDSRIFPLFREPFRPSFYDVDYWSLQRKLIHSFGLDKTFYEEGGLMKEQLIGYENLIEDLYRLQKETAIAHGHELTEARQAVETLRGRVGELEALVQARDGQLAEARTQEDTIGGRAVELEALVQVRDGELTEARQAAETLRGRVGELEALVQARDGQLAEARTQEDTLRGRVGELEPLVQARDRELVQAHGKAETLQSRVGDLEALVQARDGQLAEARQAAEALRGRLGMLEEQNRLQERLIQDSMRRLEEFLDQQNRRLFTRIVNFLFWTRGPQP